MEKKKEINERNSNYAVGYTGMLCTILARALSPEHRSLLGRKFCRSDVRALFYGVIFTFRIVEKASDNLFFGKVFVNISKNLGFFNNSPPGICKANEKSTFLCF